MRKRFFYLKFIFSFLFVFLSSFLIAQDNRTVVNIENANNARYEKDKSTENDMIILTGEVKLSVTRGTNKNIIKADLVRYDRASEMIFAEGNVFLEQTTENAGNQTVTASSLMFNTATLEGVFDDGRAVQKQSDAINLPSGSTLIVASDIFGRSESNTIAFKDGVLTFCNDEDPHWNIKASRIWLLPGGEFAFFNALLFVGPVPVFYLPAFYYPKDELIFNPVFGYGKREGWFIQTTTYIYGRKPLDTSSNTSSDDSDASEKLKALFNFVKPSSLKEQKREGLMLHNLDKDFTGNTTNYVKVMGDYYSNLGVMAGVAGVIKPQKYVSNLEFGVKLGFSNTVFKNTDGTYSPYCKSDTKYIEGSQFLGLKMPFRYSTNIKFDLTSPFSLSLSMPIYSDPFFYNDFSDRNETMDWISFLINSINEDENEDSETEMSSLSWTLSSSHSFKLPEIIKPYISTVSLNLNSSLSFSTKTTEKFSRDDIESEDETDWKKYTPNRKFYYPSSIAPAKVSMNISGTFIDFSSYSSKTKSSKTVSFVSPLIKPDELLSEKELEEKQKKLSLTENEEKSNVENGENVEITENLGLGIDNSFGEKLNNEEFVQSENLENPVQNETEKENLEINKIPDLAVASDSITKIQGLAFSSKYSVQPSLDTQLAYSSDNLKCSDDFDWNNLKSSMYTLKIPVKLNNNFSYGGNFFSISNSYSFNPVFQEHPYISTDTENGGYTEKDAVSLRKIDYAAQKKDLTNENSVSLKPFAYVSAIKDTGVSWRTNLKLIRTNFLADEYDEEKDNPKWEYITPDLDDEECVTTNALDFTFAANQFDGKITESYTLTATLKPLVEAYYGAMKFTFPYTTLNFDIGYKRKSKDDDTWVKQPFKQSFSLNLFNNTLKFSENYNYNMEEEYHDSLKFSLSWKTLSFAYNMQYTYGYDFITEDDVKSDPSKKMGWNQRADKEFLPYSLSFSYSSGTINLYAWKNRIHLGAGISTNILADLIRPTNSYFTFAPSISLKIHECLTLTLSASSKNSVIYRYFGNDIGLPGETNMFTDLVNSFRFDDDDLREASGFKLKSINFTLTHELHDWDFKFTYKMEPRLLTENGKKYYDFEPYVTISIVWRPMSAMKTEIIDNYGEWELK